MRGEVLFPVRVELLQHDGFSSWRMTGAPTWAAFCVVGGLDGGDARSRRGLLGMA